MERKAVKIIRQPDPNGIIRSRTVEFYEDRGPGRGVPRPGGVATMAPDRGALRPNGGHKIPRRTSY